MRMTGQIADEFRYNGEMYDLVGIDGDGLLSPTDFGMIPRAGSTACWRGFQMFYNCVNGELLLEQMNLNTQEAILVNGIEPKNGEYGFSHVYENLKLKVPFTGRIRIGKDFISSMYVHMGFQSSESYETVIELEIENGKVIRIKDLSSLMKQRRKQGLEKPAQPTTTEDDDVKDWIADRFSQTFESE